MNAFMKCFNLNVVLTSHDHVNFSSSENPGTNGKYTTPVLAMTVVVRRQDIVRATLYSQVQESLDRAHVELHARKKTCSES